MIFLLGIYFCVSTSLGHIGAELTEDNLIDFSLVKGIEEKVASRVPRQIPFSSRREIKPLVSEFSVKSTIISRYAFTAVSCTMVNRAAEAKDVVFQMQIPSAAFVSNFTMILGGRTYYSEVTWRKKTGDNNIHDYDKINGDRGENKMETFNASAFIPGRDKAVFLLMYEELLQRRLGMYEHVISVRPQQLVGRLSVEVNILESSGLTSLEVPPLQNNKQKSKNIDEFSPPPSTVINQTENFARITFEPNVVQQARITQNGNLGDFVVRYDVKRELSIGDIQVLNGYFVHYFAPTNLPPLPKNVVFVIDTSASMVGTKMKQTQGALFTILRDLRPDDHFNIIGFSSKIKVWQQNQLVKVSPNNIRDAKKFIFGLTPTGGNNSTLNIYNENIACYTGTDRLSLRTSVEDFLIDLCLMLVCWLTFSFSEKEPYCIKTAKSEEDDAAAQLKGFYDEIGTPLLSDIRIDYPSDSVEYVTQNMFYNYFNGSEIVVAGKLMNKSSDALHVEITASNRNKYVVLEADVKIEGVEQKAAIGSQIIEDNIQYKNHIERLWGYLTFKELLTAWHKSDRNQEKEEITRKASKLAQKYNFVTPFTLLEVKDYGFQADLPKDEFASLYTEGIGQKLLSLQGRKVTKEPPSQQIGKQKPPMSKTAADGDPHFVVDFPLSKLTVCFNIDGEPRDVLRLVSDHKYSGVTVNGQLIGAPAPPNGHKKQRTYFSKITIIINKPKRTYLEITPTKVILDSKDRLILACDKTATVKSDDLLVSVTAKSNVTVTIHETITFVILVHLYKNPAPYQRNHLGFYISNSKGLSPNSHGLLGQFLYNEVKVTQVPLSTNNGHAANQTSQVVNILKVRNRSVPVIRKQRKLYNGLHQVDCWFAKNNAEKLIDGVYQDYLLPHLFDCGKDLITNDV
ncbi:inter-alpha-trypsin inhibitor heavy chain H5 [Pyxicephalus adspersus]|uniref:inter-alpha-trypsin inhibitor heavy chain H5 n=1 Tax=Pyxicephalus adspersus TaxID=30357 RepID=UPI003B5CF8E1